MATYFTDFSGYTTGVQPSDWTLRFDASADWDVVADAGATGGQILQMVSTTAARNLLSWDAVDSDVDRDDVEIVFKARFPSSIGNKEVAAMGRASGATASAAQGYEGNLNAVNGEFRLNKFVSGSFTAMDSAAETFSTDVWYWCRLRINGTSIQARFWLDSVSEPGTWEFSSTDPDLSAAGWVGLRTFNGSPVDVDVFGVGTDGDAAPTTAPGGAVTGDMAATLANTTAAFTGSSTVTGDMAATLADTTVIAAGDHGVVGDLAATLGSTTAFFDAEFGDDVSGDMAAILASTAATADGDHGVAGTAVAALADTAAIMAGDHGVAGDLTSSMSDTAASMSGEVVEPISGDLATTLDDMSAAATGAHGVAGQLATSLGDLTLEIQVDHGTAGSVSATMGDATASMTGEHVPVVEAAVAVSLGDTAATMDGEHVAPTAGSMTVNLADTVAAFTFSAPSIGVPENPGVIEIVSNPGVQDVSKFAGVL